MMSFAPRGGSAGSKESRDPEEAGGVSELHQDLTTFFHSFFLSSLYLSIHGRNMSIHYLLGKKEGSELFG